jgi:GT2 family glycosyltransferase
MKYAVIILNWNGADDTIACLTSFLGTSEDAVAIVVDNGSTDDSPARLVAALAPRNVPLLGVAAIDSLRREVPERIALIAVGENLGFAAGCNVGLAAARALGLEVCVFLNNDTIVEPRALDRIVQRLARGDCYVCLPMLTVYGTDRIWNCGGVAYSVGLRRYHLADRPRCEGTAAGEIRCSFFTGCCFAVRTADFAARGGFSERFFFGEEDFELALWMKERRLFAICLTSAVVEHKVSASFDRAAASRQAAKSFVYYLNRFIHMRLRLGPALWAFWVAAYLPYTVVLLLRRRVVGFGAIGAFVGSLLSRARAMDRVGRADFEALMGGGRKA